MGPGELTGSACPFLAGGGMVEAAGPPAASDAAAAATAVVLALYAALDAGEAHTAAPLFTDHATFETPAETFEGRRAIADFFARRDASGRRTLHALVNLQCQALREDVVEVRGLMIAYVPGPEAGPPWVLEQADPCRHVLRRTDAGWLLLARARA